MIQPPMQHTEHDVRLLVLSFFYVFDILVDLYSQTRLISHLWDCQNCVTLTEVDINRSCHSSLARSNNKTAAEITVKNQNMLTR